MTARTPELASRGAIAAVLVATVLGLSVLAILSGSLGSANTPGAHDPLTTSGSGTTSSYPPQSWGMGMVYDSADRYYVMFGGSAPHAGTWTYLNGNWTELHPTLAPPARNYACFAYDPLAGEAVLFGGGTGGIGFARSTLNDTWTFAAGEWKNVTTTAGTPPAVKYPGCAYDPAFDGGAIILFGGANATYSVTYDGGVVWLLDDTNQTWAFVKGSGSDTYGWVQLHPRVSPPARFGASMAYNSTEGPFVLYGGAENGTSTANDSCPESLCPHLHDTWELTGSLTSNTWTEVANSPAAAPPGSIWSMMVGLAAPAEPGLIDFGGQANGYKSTNATPDATWEFEGTAWTNITRTTGTPPARFGGAIAMDPSTDSAVMFSGLGGTVANSPLRDDMWSFTGGAWHALTYPITFRESGGPHHDSWKITLSSDTVTTNSTSEAQDRTNGTWAYSIQAPKGYVAVVNGSGSILVNGRSTEVNVTFGFGFSVTVKEKGLPSGTTWNVTIGSETENSTSNKVVFPEGNGTFEYTASVAGNGSASGSFTVTGSALTVVVSFYKVTFSESGLVPGTSWSVITNGFNHSSTADRIYYYLGNGSYHYTVGSVAGYTGPTPSSGSYKIDGAAHTISVKFTVA